MTPRWLFLAFFWGGGCFWPLFLSVKSRNFYCEILSSLVHLNLGVAPFEPPFKVGLDYVNINETNFLAWNDSNEVETPVISRHYGPLRKIVKHYTNPSILLAARSKTAKFWGFGPKWSHWQVVELTIGKGYLEWKRQADVALFIRLSKQKTLAASDSCNEAYDAAESSCIWFFCPLFGHWPNFSRGFNKLMVFPREKEKKGEETLDGKKLTSVSCY